MNKKEIYDIVNPANRILLGLLMLVAGLTKIGILSFLGSAFTGNPAGITGMMVGLGFPIAGFFAWILILSEIVFGAAMLFKWKLEYTTIPLAFILVVATFTAHLGDVSGMIIRLALAANYILIGTRE